MIAETASLRTARLKEELLSCRYEICIERMKYFTEAHRQNPQAPEVIRRAEGVARTLQKMTIFIREDELLVGNETGKNLGEKVNLDLQRFYEGLDKRDTYAEGWKIISEKNHWYSDGEDSMSRRVIG